MGESSLDGSAQNRRDCFPLEENIEGVELDWQLTDDETFEDIDLAKDDDSEDVEDETIFKMAHCDFLNRLINYRFVPLSVVNDISNEFLKNYSKSNNVVNEYEDVYLENLESKEYFESCEEPK